MRTKVAVVSGASYGLGGAISNELLTQGFKVYGISRSAPKIEDALFVWLKADLTVASEISNLVNGIKEDTIDLLVNNAGTAFEKPALDFSDADFEKMFGLNFVAPIKLTAVLFPKLRSGLVVNISSISDRYPDPLLGLYGSSKAALNLYFETIAAEYKDVKVISLLPNYIDTPLLRKLIGTNHEFSWEMSMTTEQVAKSVIYVLDRQEELETGSRMIVISSIQDSCEYSPEKLLVYNVDSKEVKKITH